MPTEIFISLSYTANSTREESARNRVLHAQERTLSSGKTDQNVIVLHTTQLLPDPYPQYPELVTRIFILDDDRKIDKSCVASRFSHADKDFAGPRPNYPRLAMRISVEGEDSLVRREEAFVPFLNMLHLLFYKKDSRGDTLNLTCNMRHARGSIVRNPNSRVKPITALDASLVDQVLERALQQRDFQAIRAILNYEGYGVPIKEPNDLVIPETWDADKSDADEEEVTEIEMTSEEYQLWQEMEDAPPEPITEPSSFVDTPEFKEFAEKMARKIPLHLEHAIRQRDIPTLRMWLRLYGRHNIATPEPGTALLRARRKQGSAGAPPTLDC